MHVWVPSFLQNGIQTQPPHALYLHVQALQLRSQKEYWNKARNKGNFRPGRAWQKPVLDPSVHHPSIQKCCLVSPDVTFLISEKLGQFSLLFQTLSVSGIGKSGKNTFKQRWHYQHDVSYVHLALTNTASWVLSLGKAAQGCAWAQLCFAALEKYIFQALHCARRSCQQPLGSGWRNARLHWALSSWLTVSFRKEIKVFIFQSSDSSQLPPCRKMRVHGLKQASGWDSYLDYREWKLLRGNRLHHVF